MAVKVKPEEVVRHEEVYSVGLDVSQRSTNMGTSIYPTDLRLLSK